MGNPKLPDTSAGLLTNGNNQVARIFHCSREILSGVFLFLSDPLLAFSDCFENLTLFGGPVIHPFDGLVYLANGDVQFARRSLHPCPFVNATKPRTNDKEIVAPPKKR